MVHPAELAVFDHALHGVDFLQLPVRAERLPRARWVGGHYVDEFAEAHARTMVVRHALGAALPLAGVGCAIVRPALAALARGRAASCHPDDAGPFAPDCLTEDYELGWQLARQGWTGAFLRLRDGAGELIGPRAYFPDRWHEAVQQKTRWVHGIACQGWDRIGWCGPMRNRWMAVRDRRMPLVALVLTATYLAMVLGAAVQALALAGLGPGLRVERVLTGLSALCMAGLVWRALLRGLFTARDHGLHEGALAVLRIPVANVIAILAARRALFAYARALLGAPVRWDKTVHRDHPAGLVAAQCRRA